MSSEQQKLSGVPMYCVLIATEVRNGLMRPGIEPTCGLCWSSRSASENAAPRFTAAAPRWRAASSIRLSVPISSASPHRPQLETRAASSVNSGGSKLPRRCLAVAGGGVHGVEVEAGDDVAPEELHRAHDDIGRQRVGRRAERELVEAHVDPVLHRAGAVVRVADHDEALRRELFDLLRR